MDADFSGLPLTGAAPLTVQFTDESSPDPTSRLWDFGDGETSTEEDPEHIYTNGGYYTVSLTATKTNNTGWSQIATWDADPYAKICDMVEFDGELYGIAGGYDDGPYLLKYNSITGAWDLEISAVTLPGRWVDSARFAIMGGVLYAIIERWDISYNRWFTLLSVDFDASEWVYIDQISRVPEMAIFAFIEYNNKLYISLAVNTAYFYESSGGALSVVTGTPIPITNMIESGGLLYTCRQNDSDGTLALYTYNGTTWSTVVASSVPTTFSGIIEFNSVIYIDTITGLYYYNSDAGTIDLVFTTTDGGGKLLINNSKLYLLGHNDELFQADFITNEWLLIISELLFANISAAVVFDDNIYGSASSGPKLFIAGLGGTEEDTEIKTNYIYVTGNKITANPSRGIAPLKVKFSWETLS